MIETPWFMLSPSPTSFIQYFLLTWFASRILSKSFNYKNWILNWIDGFFVVAFFVVLTDSFWAGWCALKWVPVYPADFWQIISSFLRDIVAALLFFLLIPFKRLNFGKKTMLWLFICFFSQGIWFFLAPSPAYTDYVFAWRHGFSLSFIVVDFVFSHIIMRIPLWITIFYSLKIEDKTIRIYKEKKLNGVFGE